MGTALALGSCAFKEASRVESGTGGFGIGSGGGGTGGRIYVGSGGAGPCVGLKCQLTTCTGAGCLAAACSGTATTTVTGKAYDPAGKVPLYNVSVYVPNRELAPLPEGTACLRCDTSVSGEPLAQTVTDAFGNFKLENVPVGADVPIVIQVGKWRRQSKIPSVAACTETKLTDPNITRLPRNQGEGHLPRIALTTGGLDALECLLRKIGIEDTEFTPEAGSGRVNLFAGGNVPPSMTGVGTMSYAPTLNAGAMFTRAPGWWDSVNNLLPYDLLLHSCEGTERPTNKSAAALQAFQDYANMGGRVFASHWHNYWLENPANGPFRTVATFHHLNDPPSPFTSTIDTTFPKGQALSDWLFNVGASTTAGSLVINGAKHTVDAVLPGAQRWIFSDAAPASVQYLSFTTPLAAAEEDKCGKVVFSDLHVSSGSGTVGMDDQSKPNLPFPTGCVTTELSAQEKALEFMLFDLSACTPPGIP